MPHGLAGAALSGLLQANGAALREQAARHRSIMPYPYIPAVGTWTFERCESCRQFARGRRLPIKRRFEVPTPERPRRAAITSGRRPTLAARRRRGARRGKHPVSWGIVVMEEAGTRNRPDNVWLTMTDLERSSAASGIGGTL